MFGIERAKKKKKIKARGFSVVKNKYLAEATNNYKKSLTSIDFSSDGISSNNEWNDEPWYFLDNVVIIILILNSRCRRRKT